MQPRTLNEDQIKDITTRIDGFKKDYEKLCAQYQVEIMTKPEFQHATSGVFGVVVLADFVDLKYRNPSPLHAPKN